MTAVIGPCCHIFDAVGEHAFLSNYADTPIRWESETWPTVEHAYQAAKFADDAVRALIRDAAGGDAAKAIAWDKRFAERLSPGWDTRRQAVMASLLRLKFDQNPSAAAALAATWPQPILESSIDDNFWGVGADGSGRNILGRLLEDERERHFAQPRIFELAAPPCGRGGPSRTLAGLVRWASASAGAITLPDLAYEGFRQLDIGSSLTAFAGHGVDEAMERHAELLDQKYADYRWTEDARAVVPNWPLSFHGLLTTRTRDLYSARIVVVGAGSADESQMLWRGFAGRATLIDWGRKLSARCAEHAPQARTLRRRAEDLHGVPDASADIYVALRTYDSACLDVEAALREARRTLRLDGALIISISDGYLTTGGDIIRGQIGVDGRIDRAAPWKRLSDVVERARSMGFADIGFFDLRSEIGLTARLSAG